MDLEKEFEKFLIKHKKQYNSNLNPFDIFKAGYNLAQDLKEKLQDKIDELKEWKGRHQDGDKAIYYLENIINDLQILVDKK